MTRFALFPTYLEWIKKSVGTDMFRSTFFEENGTILDVTQNGDLSCAIYVTSILKLFDLIKEGHVNVDSSVKDLLNSGWVEIAKPKPGAIIVWATKMQKSGPHKHIGFCIDDHTAISNDGENTKVPIQHSIDYDGTRAIEKILWHPRLDQ